MDHQKALDVQEQDVQLWEVCEQIGGKHGKLGKRIKKVVVYI